jgi:hypothetical protein
VSLFLFFFSFIVCGFLLRFVLCSKRCAYVNLGSSSLHLAPPFFLLFLFSGTIFSLLLPLHSGFTFDSSLCARDGSAEVSASANLTCDAARGVEPHPSLAGFFFFFFV